MTRTQAAVAEKKEEQKDLTKLLEDTREKREELKVKLQRLTEDDEHYSKLVVMKAYNLETLTKKLQRATVEEARLKHIRETLQSESTELEEYFGEQKAEVSDIRRNVVKENDTKIGEERELRKQLNELKG